MHEKEAELIGMHVGDGTLYLAGNGQVPVWELRGSINEQEFYEHVKDLIKKLFDIEVKPKYRGPNSYGIQTTNKIITNFFIDKGFKPGTKTYTVRIPDYIKNADINVKKAFIRGLFDTDGCICFDKNRTAFHYYPKIEFNFASKDLRDDLVLLLNELGFRVHFWDSVREDGFGFKMCAAGFENLEKLQREIIPANSKHLKRIEDGLKNKEKIPLKIKHKP